MNFAIQHNEIAMEVTKSRSASGELDLCCEKEKFSLVQHRMTLTSPACKVGLGTIAAALAALSMAVLGHFVI